MRNILKDAMREQMGGMRGMREERKRGREEERKRGREEERKRGREEERKSGQYTAIQLPC